MPTIIDSLIITLGMDTSKFTQGQQRAIQSLQQTAVQALTQARTIQTGAAQTANFYTGLAAPLQQTNQHLTNLGSQARRTGSTVATAANVGAAGLTNMVSSALAAYGALKAVQGVLESVRGASARGAEAGRIASEIGGSTQGVDAFAKAANVATNAPTDAVKGELAAIQDKLNEWRQGKDVSGWLNQMAVAGVNNLSQTDNAMDVARKFADVSANLAPDVAASRARQVGLGATGRFLHGGSAAVNAAVANQMNVSVTDGQSFAYQRLQRAVNSVFTAYEGLVNKFVEANPGVASAIENFDGWIRTLQSTPGGLKAVEYAFDAVSVAIGTTLVFAIGRAIWAINRFWALPALRVLGGAGKFIGGAASVLGGAAAGATAAGVVGTFLPDKAMPEGGVEARRGLWDTTRRWINRQITGAKPGEENLPGGATPQTVPSPGGATPQTVPSPGSIAPGSSEPSPSVLNAVRFSLQATGEKFKRYCATLVNQSLESAGIRGSGSALASSFKTYGSAVEKEDVRKGDIFYSGPSGEGNTGHVGFALGPIQNGQVPVMSSHMQGDPNNPAGSEWRNATNLRFRRPGEDAVKHMSAIRSANASRAANADIGNTTNTNDLDINGGIHIHTAERDDVAGVAKTISPEISKNLQVSPFNLGIN
jgi:hypothetical protein